MRLERIAIPLVAIALSVFGTSRLIEAIDPGADAASGGSLPEAARPDRGSSQREAGGDREGRRRGKAVSFLTPAGMGKLKALLAKEAGPGGRVTLFRLQARAAQVHLARGAGGGALLVIEEGPRIRFRASTPTAIPGGFAASGLDPRAPSRIGAGIARLSSASLADVDYMVFSVSPIDRAGRWDAFLANSEHTHFHADAHGRHVTRP